MRKLSRLFFGLSLLSGIAVQAQNDPLEYVSIASPTAASLGKYADFPVSYHTGLVNINIPIYNVENGPLDLPISLSYHAGGLKVLESASWVGHGWALNAGGVITRSVRGGPDDRGLNAAVTQYGHFHDYGYNNYLHEVGGPPCTGIPCPPGAPRHADDMAVLATTKDGEPDLYTFNFGKYSGKFYFRDDRTPVLVPYQDIKIEPILADESVSIAFIYMLGFKITTPDGTKYYFGKNQEADGNIDAIEITYSVNTHSYTVTNQGAVSSWFLNKIESADNLFSIKLTYASDQSSNYTLSMFPVANTVTSNQFFSYYGDNKEYDLAKEFINGVRLKEIIFPNGTLTFKPGLTREDVGDYQSRVMNDVPNTHSKSLGEIQINNNSGFCKTFKLYQSYFYDATSPMNGEYSAGAPTTPVVSDRYHLRLDSLKEMTCDSGTQIPPYIFSYYSEKVSRKLTFGQDHWGFYNGISNNSTLIPTYTVNYETISGADRDPHWPAMRGGALQKITYPTGGFNEFEYEPHDTYGTTVSYSYTEQISGSMGYDGNPGPYVTYKDLPAGVYKLEITNEAIGSSANITVYNASTGFSQSLAAAPGGADSRIFSIAAGNYQFTLSKGTLGSGCYFSFKLQTTTSTTSNMTVGGLRIKKITTNDGITPNNIIKNYSYSLGSQSAGVLYSRPIYVSILRNDIVKLIGGGWSAGDYGLSANGCPNIDASPTQPYYKSGTGIMPLATTQGNHIGYEEVKVSQSSNGYSIYRYYGSNIWQTINSDIVTRNILNYTCDASIPNFPAAPLPFEFKRGELKYEGHFNENGQAIKQTDYYYDYEQDSVGTPGYIVSMTGYFWGTEYELFGHRKVRSENVTNELDISTGQYITNTYREYYGSKFHNEPTRIVTYTSGGDSLIANNKYAFDYRVSICDSIRSGNLDYLNAYNVVFVNYMNNLICTDNDWNCRWLAYQQYRWDRRNVRVNFVNHRRAKFMDAGNLFANNHLAVKNAALSELKPILQLHDDHHNALIETSNWRNANLIRSSFTRYDFSTNPLTSVYPNKLQVIALSIPSGSFTQSNTNGNNTSLIKDNRYIDENTYKFHLGNLVEITKADGVANSYIWGVNNTAPIVKAIGVDHNTLLTAYNAVGGNLNTIRSQPALSGALVHTYTYLPLVGLTSESNEVNRKLNYDFDVLGRMKTIKDHNLNVLQVLEYQFQGSNNQ